MVSFQGPFLESRRKPPFSIGVFLAGADGLGRGGDYFVLFFFFCLVSPGQGGHSSCTAGTPECPPPHSVAEGGLGHPVQAFRTPPGGDALAAAHSRWWRALCSQDRRRLWGTPCSPSSAPPRLPREKPAAGGSEEPGAHP